jgi:hypothetical protein
VGLGGRGASPARDRLPFLLKPRLRKEPLVSAGAGTWVRVRVFGLGLGLGLGLG